jgi:hypothetical protein
VKITYLSSLLTATAAIVLVANNANAVSFTGYDQNFKPLIATGIPPSTTGNPPFPLTVAESPNSQAAYAQFIADTNTVTVSTEGFESFSTSATTGQTIDGLITSISNVNATFSYLKKSDNLALATKVQKADATYGLFGGVSGNGTYPTDGTQGLSINSANKLSIAFASPLRAFGYFGTDLGDNNNVLTMIFTLNGNPVESVIVPTFSGGQNSSKFFFGYVGDTPTTLFDKVEFSSSLNSSGDAIGIDQIRVASAAQVTGTTIFVNPTSVPEPSSMLGTLPIGGSILALKRKQKLDRSARK